MAAGFTAEALAGRVNGALARVGDVDGDGDLDGTGIALSNSSVAENAAGAVVGALTVAAPEGAAVTWEVLNGGAPDSRFIVDTAGGTPVLRLKPGIALDHEAQAAAHRHAPRELRGRRRAGELHPRRVDRRAGPQ